MTEKEKVVIHKNEGDGSIVEAIGKLTGRVQRTEDDIVVLKENDKDFKSFTEMFQIHITRDEEQKKVLNTAVENLTQTMDGVKTLCSVLGKKQSEQDKELLRVEMKEELRNEKNKVACLEEKLNEEKTNFSSRLWEGFQDKAISIIVGITLGGGFLLALYKMIEPILQTIPK